MREIGKFRGSLTSFNKPVEERKIPRTKKKWKNQIKLAIFLVLTSDSSRSL
jgi:hypothetical protein